MVTSYDVMISHRTHITTDGLHAWDSFECMMGVYGFVSIEEEVRS